LESRERIRGRENDAVNPENAEPAHVGAARVFHEHDVGLTRLCDRLAVAALPAVGLRGVQARVPGRSRDFQLAARRRSFEGVAAH
jgi:hypothetical protein